MAETDCTDDVIVSRLEAMQREGATVKFWYDPEAKLFFANFIKNIEGLSPSRWVSAEASGDTLRQAFTRLLERSMEEHA